MIRKTYNVVKSRLNKVLNIAVNRNFNTLLTYTIIKNKVKYYN